MSIFGRSTTFGLSVSANSSIVRGLARIKRPNAPTPPNWYQKHALMYAQYTPDTPPTSLAPVNMCNVHDKGLYSMVLDKWIRFKVSASALEMIDRMGGLDVYILRTDLEKLGGRNSVAGVFRGMLEKRLAEMRASDASSAPAELSKIVYSDGEQKLTWRDGLDEEFWTKLQ